jgi:NhaA family Na+:H+ antiporter
MSAKRQIRVPHSRVARRLPPFDTEFVDVEVLSGIVLAAATVVALLWANLDPSGYEDVWHTALPLDLDLRHFVNDGLMALFFFVVGLEIKRELVLGELRDPRTAAVPVAAAVGGMVVPALIYLAVNAGGPGSRGWGIPMATDIAFALAVLALAGSRAPRELKLFLLTLAIVDDIGAIAVIALFYSDHISLGWLLEALAVTVLVVALRRVGLTHPAWYAVPAALLWLGTYESGVHATIAGVILGLLTPTGDVGGRPVLTTLEDRLHPVSSFVVVPLFALANAGVVFTGDGLHQAATGAVAWGVLLGLVVGKPIGILGATALALRSRLGVLPGELTLRAVAGVALVAGIGFTVSLFVADLAFTGDQLEAAKVAILVASVVAAGVGSLVVRRTAGTR